jgi:D-glycerate 3-kinase
MSKPNFKDTFPWPPECTSQQQIDYKQILDANRSTLTAFIASEKLPESFYAVMEQHILPLSVWLLMELQGFPYRSHPCPIIGITGAQGSGKTTITSALSMMLGLLGVRCCTLSIDDFYLTKSARQQLGLSVHPLLATRGVPGTHEIALLDTVVEQLLSATDQSKTTYPRFNKAIDDRFPESAQNEFVGRPDMILLEGWCIGARPENADSLLQPINILESSEDPDATWRNYVNAQLADNYAALFNKIDLQIFLAVAGMEVVFKQRTLQEQKLRDTRNTDGHSGKNPGEYQAALDSDDALRRFIMHYERITQNLLRDMPGAANFCLRIGDQHQIEAVGVNWDSSSEQEIALLVFSDLDGTLLDHDNYSFEAAVPALTRLRDKHIPLILNSSKTAAELLSIRQSMHNNHPFIVENGSALYIPADYFNEHFPEQGKDEDFKEDDFKIVTFGADYRQILNVLDELRTKFNYQFTGFNDFSVQQLADNTGLLPEQAALAKQRAASEPIIWQDSDERLREFLTRLEQQQLSTLQGGRFLHVLGNTDKAQPIHYLLERYQQTWNRVVWRSIALGDSKNDAAMLQASDYPVVVKNPHATPFQLDRDGILYTEEIGPAGWNQAMQTLLTKYLSN